MSPALAGLLIVLSTTGQKPDVPRCVGKITAVTKGTIRITRYCKVFDPGTVTVASNYDARKSAVALYPGDKIDGVGINIPFEYSVKIFKDGVSKPYAKPITISKALGQADILGTPLGSAAPILFPWDNSFVRPKNFFLVVPNENGNVSMVDIIYESKGRLKVRLSDCFEVKRGSQFDETTRYDLASSIRSIEASIAAQFDSPEVKNDEVEWFQTELKSEAGVRVSLVVKLSSGKEVTMSVKLRDREAEETQMTVLMDTLRKDAAPEDIEEKCEGLREANQACDFANVLMFLANINRPAGNYFSDCWFLINNGRKKKGS